MSHDVTRQSQHQTPCRPGWFPTTRHLHLTGLGLLVTFAWIAQFSRGDDIAGSALLILAALLGLFGIYHASEGGHLVVPKLIDVVVSVLATGITSIAVRPLGLPQVLCSTGVAILGCTGLWWAQGSDLRERYSAPIYVGSFVGITSALVFHNAAWVMAAGGIAGVLWSASREAWVGLGGKMGTIALGGVLIAAAMASATHHLGDGADHTPLTGVSVAIVIICVVAAQVTWVLNRFLGLGPVLSSAIPTFVAALVLAAVPAHLLTPAQVDALAAVWFSSSFVGMTSRDGYIHPFLSLLMAGVVLGLLFLSQGSRLEGMGGLAGLLALTANLITLGAAAIITRRWRKPHVAVERLAQGSP